MHRCSSVVRRVGRPAPGADRSRRGGRADGVVLARMTTRARCYVASPFGFTESGRAYYATAVLPSLSAVVEPVDPWALTDESEIAAARDSGQLREMMLTIGRRNTEAIRASDLLVAVLEGQEPDAGTVAELGYAAALGKRCYGLRSDLREAGDPAVLLNLQVESFIVESGGSIETSLADLVHALRGFVP
jgi:nucleoside 2-deoxyribosyltransferase